MNKIPDFTFEEKDGNVVLGVKKDLFAGSTQYHKEFDDFFLHGKPLPKHIVEGIKREVRNTRLEISAIVQENAREGETNADTLKRLSKNQYQELLERVYMLHATAALFGDII